MPIELTAQTDADARLVAIAESLSEELAARAAEHDLVVAASRQVAVAAGAERRAGGFAA